MVSFQFAQSIGTTLLSFNVLHLGEHVDLAINEMKEKIGEVTSEQSMLNSAFIRVFNKQNVMEKNFSSLQSQASKSFFISKSCNTVLHISRDLLILYQKHSSLVGQRLMIPCSGCKPNTHKPTYTGRIC